MAGNFLTHAARANGVNRDTVYSWMATIPEFAESVEQARSVAVTALVANVVEARHGAGERDWKAASWLLARLAPNAFGDRSVLDRQREALQAEKLEAEIAALNKGATGAGVNLTPAQFDQLFATKFGQLPGRAKVEVIDSVPTVNAPGRGDAE